MLKLKPILQCLCGAVLAGGCSVLQTHDAAQPRIVPVAGIKHGASNVDALYATGRYFQGQTRYDQAIAAYRRVLEESPGHTEAHNALGVIYASQGRFEQAVEEFSKAIASAPDAAHVHSNLGYALVLQDRAAEAVQPLERARSLDAGNARATENLRIARARLAAAAGATGQAPGANGNVVEPTAPARATNSTWFPEQKAEVSPPTDIAVGTENGMRLQAISPSVYELRVVGAGAPSGASDRFESGSGPALESAAPTVDPGSPKRNVRLEVANGNGIAGFARKTSAFLKAAGFAAARLTNQRPFVQSVTEIQYRPGFSAEAAELRTALAGRPTLRESNGLGAEVQVRVLLGRDSTPATLLTGRVEAPELLAQAASTTQR